MTCSAKLTYQCSVLVLARVPNLTGSSLPLGHRRSGQNDPGKSTVAQNRHITIIVSGGLFILELNKTHSAKNIIDKNKKDTFSRMIMFL